MSSKKEEERNEKIIRGLMKLPPNRRCINCNSLGPQYVCTNFWTFVCISCSGIHREFTHRVKSVSMAKFTKDEVEALQNGGNQRAREIFLKDWDMQQMRLPDSSKPDKIREFIKNVYVERKYAGGRSSDKPPRDMQSLRSLDESRRASSYHSYSQSPPYDHQYEDRRYGKQSGFLTRKPGSDRVHYEGKISSFMYSPGSLREQMYEDRFANESSGPRTSDFSVSNTGEPFRSGGQSPNFQHIGYSSPPLQQARDALVEDPLPRMQNQYPELSIKGNADGIRHPQRTTSLGSVGSFGSNCTSLKSVNSGSLMEVVFEPDHANRTQQLETSSLPSSSKHSMPSQAPNIDLFSLPVTEPSMTSPDTSIDFFAEINNQTAPVVSEQKPLGVLEGSGGWATFDIPQVPKPESETDIGISAKVGLVSGGPKKTIDKTHGDPQWFSAQISKPSGVLPLMEDQWHVCLNEDKGPSHQKNSHSWDAFGGSSTGGDPYNLFDQLPDKSEFQMSMQQVPAFGALHSGLKVSEDSNNDGTQKATVNDRFLVPSLPFNGVPGQSGPPPSLPGMGVATEHQKSSNPFDFPYDTEVEPDNLFLDMSSLQAALPNTQLPPPFLGGLPQPLFPPNSVKTYIPHVPQEGLPYMGMQAPSSQLPNVPSQGPVASLGGNPFA